MSKTIKNRKDNQKIIKVMIARKKEQKNKYLIY